MPEYQPEKLAFASLEPGEIHHYSFFMYGIKPRSLMFQHYVDGSTYIGHLTDRRLILEPWKLPGFVGVAIDIVKTVTTSLSPSVGIDQIIKGLAKQTKGSLARTTFMADSQMYLSIPYKNIVAFETGSITFIKNSYVRVLTDIGSDKDAFLFRVEKVTDGAKRGIGGEPGTRTNRNFYEFGNQFLKSYRG